MPRANRYRIAGQIWHLTDRCHRQQFLLKFARDRRAWVEWLYEALLTIGLVGIGLTLAPPVLDSVGRLPLIHYVYSMYAWSLVALPLTQAAGRGVAALSIRRERWTVLAALVHLQPELVVADADGATVLGTLRGRTIRGKDYENLYSFALRIAGGQVVEAWELFDSVHFLAQVR